MKSPRGARPKPRPRLESPRASKAQRTRAAILAAAEAVFAEKGYAAARLEDVAERVGLRRASLVYHFRDKRELYEAVLAGVLGELLERYRVALAPDVPLSERLERVVRTWVSFVGERPTLARLLLREAAEASPSSPAARLIEPVANAVRDAILEGQRKRLLRPIDPIHFIFSVVGATVFFVAATPALARGWRADPLSRKQLDAFREETLDIARRLLGTDEAADAGESRPPKRRRPRAMAAERARASRQPGRRLS